MTYSRQERGTALRLKQLDVLRTVAVLLVICHHNSIDNVVSPVGWVGVDLFFVLSGFLVAGLLLAEYQKNGELNIGRFLFRRGMKIYPAFWSMIVATIIISRL